MNIQIGIIAGEILELLEKNNGLFVFGEIQSNVQRPHDLTMMSLGWLLGESHVQILEDPSRACYRNKDEKGIYSNEAFMFDLIVENKLAGISQARVKDMAHKISIVADKILILVEACEDLLTLQTLERNLNEHRDIILMSLGWLIREGYVRGIAATKEILIFRLSKKREMTDMEAVALSVE